MSCMARILKDRYIHNMSYAEVIAIITFLREKGEHFAIVHYDKNDNGKRFDNREDAISYFERLKAARFRADISEGVLIFSEHRNDPTENGRRVLMECIKSDSIRDWDFFCDIVNTIKRRETNKNHSNTQEDTEMKFDKVLPNLKFGKVTDGSMKMSHMGIAVKNKENVFVSYDKTKAELVNVDITSINSDGFLYQMPVQTSEIKVGNCILHNGGVYYVTNVNPLTGVSYYDGTEEVIKITSNMFGFNFVTKVVSMFEMASAVEADNSGNVNMNAMLPLLLLGKDGDSSGDTVKTMLLMQMMQANGGQTMDMSNMFSNPMMLLALSDKDADTGALLAMSMMMQNTSNNQ